MVQRGFQSPRTSLTRGIWLRPARGGELTRTKRQAGHTRPLWNRTVSNFYFLLLKFYWLFPCQLWHSGHFFCTCFMWRESVIRSVVIIIPRIWTVLVTSYVRTRELDRPQRDLNPVPRALGQPRYQWAILAPLSAGILPYKPWRPNVFFQLEIIINVLVGFFCFILIRMLWVYSHVYVYIFVLLQHGDLDSRQILTSKVYSHTLRDKLLK